MLRVVGGHARLTAPDANDPSQYIGIVGEERLLGADNRRDTEDQGERPH